MTKQQQALSKLRDMLEQGPLSPGSRLPSLLELAEKFGMKERPVREAIKILVAENKLHTVSGRGIFVFDPQERKPGNIMFLVDMGYTAKINQHAEDIFLQMEVYHGMRDKARARGWNERLYSFDGNIRNVIREYKRQDYSGIISMAELDVKTLCELGSRIGMENFVDVQFASPDCGTNEIRIDFEPGINAVLEQAHKLNHRKFAMLYGENIAIQVSHMKRFQTFIAFCQHKQFPLNPAALIACNSTELDGYRATRTLLRNAPETTFIFAANDQRAKGVLQALLDMGITPGREVSVVGFDNAPFAEEIQLATVAVPRYEAGVRAVEIIHELRSTSRPRRRVENLQSRPLYRASLGPLMPRG